MLRFKQKVNNIPGRTRSLLQRHEFEYYGYQRMFFFFFGSFRSKQKGARLSDDAVIICAPVWGCPEFYFSTIPRSLSRGAADKSQYLLRTAPPNQRPS